MAQVENWYAALDAEHWVSHYESALEEEVGPSIPSTLGPYTYRLVDVAEVYAAPPTSTSRRRRDGAELVWVETAVLPSLLAAALAQTYLDVDAVYKDAIGMRATEYARAEEFARAYLAADPGPTVVSGYITGHAQHNPTGIQQTNDWAAQQIIERADVFRWAELQMRNVRFARQADMRAAATPEELAVAVDTWNGFITYLRALLGLPPA